MHELRSQGYLVVRAAGSHSAFDLVAIKITGPTAENPDYDRGEIRLIQCKSGEHSTQEKEKAMEEINQYTGIYLVIAEVR